MGKASLGFPIGKWQAGDLLIVMEELNRAVRYSVKIRVISQKGHCAAGHKVGDEFIVTRYTPSGLCLFAYSAIDPDVRTLMYGGTYPWSKERDIYVGCCPDSVNPVVFELRRIPFQGE